MDEMRAMLDELMGQDRDGDREIVRRSVTDKEICKFYLLGFCPFTEFERTKHDFGACQNIHDDAVKADWEKLDDKEKERLGYERDLKRWIEKLMVELRTKIAKNEERLFQQEAVVLLAEDQAKLTRLNDEIQESVAQAEAMAEQGDVDGAQAAVAQTDRLKTQVSVLTEEASKRAGGGASRYGQQEVCPLSGVIINQEESRVRDHKNGRNYKAWCMAHEKYKEVNATLQRRDEERGRHLLPPPPVVGSSHPRSRERDHERSADRDGRNRDANRDRHRDRDRDRDRHRDRDRDDRRERDRHDRGSSRSEHYHRERRRSRSRSRGRDRPRERGDHAPQPNGSRHR
ncbi:hypothetical protein WJX73_004648 [Symbiochloris irregularis]|uniref:Luc7-like protein 3 n=1 Tax=Symbiochloris irregularis TaxID=706552 RepID=A0AAW1P806_9CHLO